MKRMVISISILLVASLAFIGSLSVAGDRTSRLRERLETPNLDPDDRDESKVDTVARPNAQLDVLADPNEIKARIKAFEGLEKALEEVESKSKSEQRAWLQRRTENKANLAKEVQRQIEAELTFIRKLAVEEGAEKTTAAIDGLLLSRDQRSEKLIKELQEEKRQQRQELRQDQRSRGRGRATRRRQSEDSHPRG